MSTLEIKTNNGIKKIRKIPDSYSKFLDFLQKYIKDITSKYIFKATIDSIQLPIIFYNESTYTTFHSILSKINQVIPITIEEVKEYPQSESQPIIPNEIVMNPLLSNHFQTCLDAHFGTLKNSLKEIPLEYLEDCCKKYTHTISLNNSKSLNKTIQPYIICSNCFNIECKGNVFICSECIHYTLCSICERRNDHDIDHTLIRITEPIEYDLKKYDCLIDGNAKVYECHLLKGDMNVKIDITLINNGEYEWNNKFYLRSVAYGDFYLNGARIIIDNDVYSKDRINKTIVIQFNQPGVYQSKWRMFNENGIPFGTLFIAEIIVH